MREGLSRESLIAHQGARLPRRMTPFEINQKRTDAPRAALQ